MIISVSRRTDIPAFYTNWFLNRIKEGFVDVINPFNPKQANRISLSKENVECFVFWTKNPKPLLDRIDELDGYNYYFQFTLNSYGKDIEPNVPSKAAEVINTFIELSKKIGKEKIIWRYDPILLTDKYTIEYHIKYFEKLARKLSPYTKKCVISFLDLYKKTERNMKHIQLEELTVDKMNIIAEGFSQVCKKYDLELATCSEELDLEKYNIKHNKCIDDELIETLFKISLVNKKRDNQRSLCGCIKCHDIGTYNTCLHNCVYCYANFNKEQSSINYSSNDLNSSIMVGKISNDVKIYE